VTIVINLGSSRTLGDLKARIADELDRSDLTSQIGLAIDDAITEAASNRFWFNEVRGLVIPLAAGQEYYGSNDFSALTEIDAIYLSINGQRRNMFPASSLTIDQWRDGSTPTGEPYQWARYGTSLRVYPTPAIAYSLVVDGVSRLPALINDAQANAWTNEGEKLIRAIAKRELLANVIRDFEEAQAQQQLVTNALKELQGKSYDKSATGQMSYYG
jgi:hypothetical protein